MILQEKVTKADSNDRALLGRIFTLQGSRKIKRKIDIHQIYGNHQLHTICLMELFDEIAGGEYSTQVTGNPEKNKKETDAMRKA